MSHKKNDELVDTLRDIGYGMTPGYDPLGPPEPGHFKAGPNNWDNIKPEDFGPEEDFRVHESKKRTVIYAVSEAALQWIYRHLGEWVPRWEDRGFMVEPNYLAIIVARMRQDKLMSRDDYETAMEGLVNEQHAWNSEEGS